MFDTHVHLFDKKILDTNIDVLLNQLKENKFVGINCICETEDEINLFLNYNKTYNFLYCSFGIHPHNAKFFTEEKLTIFFNKLYSTQRLIAIGETGLDFYYNFSDKNFQIKCFLSHIYFAQQYNLPLVIHSRNSDNEVYSILKENNVNNAVIHCFSGDYQTAKKYLDLGLFLGFSGIVTFKKNQDLIETIKKMPKDRILVETDAPYLTPAPFRGKTNTSLYLPYIIKKIAEIKNVDTETMQEQLDKNAFVFFKLK